MSLATNTKKDALIHKHKQKESFIVGGFIREIKPNKIVPVEIAALVLSFAHNEFCYLYNLDGTLDRDALQSF